MAQTRRKRSTKHRGNAAGMIETRGRTGRKPTAQEQRKGKSGGGKRAAPRTDKYDKPPTWRGAFNRAAIASVLVVAFSILLLGFKPANMLALLPIVLLIYVPLGYYTDLFLYRRRQRQKGGAK
jgi:hypothetical protein